MEMSISISESSAENGVAVVNAYRSIGRLAFLFVFCLLFSFFFCFTCSFRINSYLNFAVVLGNLHHD